MKKGRKLFGLGGDGGAAPVSEAEVLASGAAYRAEAVQRVQVGVFGIAAMLLLVGLASIIGSRADKTDASAVPDAAPTTEPRSAPAPGNPLADAGVVPDIPAEPTSAPLVDPLVLPPPTSGPTGAANERPKP
ncbi:MAG: hypothetical protein ACXIT4_12965 [Erythrobacter sp.]